MNAVGPCREPEKARRIRHAGCYRKINAHTDAADQSNQDHSPNSKDQNVDQPIDDAMVSHAAENTISKPRKPRRSPEQIRYELQKSKREAAVKVELAALADWKECQRKVKLIAGSKTFGGLLERIEKGCRESVVALVQPFGTVNENQALDEYLEAIDSAPPMALKPEKSGSHAKERGCLPASSGEPN